VALRPTLSDGLPLRAFLSTDCSSADFTTVLNRAKQMPILIVIVEMRSNRSKGDFAGIKML
jgi:hypothetical protein